MKPTNSSLAMVTAVLEPSYENLTHVRGWSRASTYTMPLHVVEECYGVVPAFAKGVADAFREGAEAVICLHDDVEILDADWDLVVMDALDHGVKFAGFGGAPLLGSADLYHTPYNPMQLARGGFVSNMRDAEAHGKRSRKPVPCVVFDGFCQIGTKDWFGKAWEWLAHSGITHHAYDAALGALAARAGVQPGLMLPIACHHYGGRTAVGSTEYQQWARTQDPEGDHGFWVHAHKIVYEEFRHVLPISV
jgi:hypothetical protein